MSFFSNLFKAATPTEALNFREAPIGQGTVGVPASTTDTTDYAKKQMEGHGGSFEENIVPVQSPRMALAISAVYRAIELRAKTIGQMQLQYQRLDREGGNFVMDVSTSDRYQSQGTKINYLLQVLTRSVSGTRGAQGCIALLVSLVNLCTANNTVAIITTGPIAREIGTRYGVDPRKNSSLLDTC